ncbi:CBN-MLTN-9 protein, partial [Aphelenchoides avenae]
MHVRYAIIVLVVAIVESGLAVISDAPKEPDLSKFEKLRVNSKNYDKIHNMHKNHYYGALKAIIGQLGRELYRKLPIDEKWRLARCLDRIEDRRDLIESARCVTDSRYRNWEIWLEEVIEDDAIARDGGKR